MQYIFIHPNFPAQFRHMAAFLGKDPENNVIFITTNPRPEWKIPGVKKIVFKQDPVPDHQQSDALTHFSRTDSNGRAIAKILQRLKHQKFIPDLICGHSGWGTTMYVKDIFPQTPFLGYFEWFYHAVGADVAFEKKIMPDPEIRIRIRNKNLSILNDLAACDHGLCPTWWQKTRFPKEFHHKLSVIHDGINPEFFTPTPDRKLHIPTLDLSFAREIVTYTARGFEPYRGFPQFIEAIPNILEKRPDAHVVIVGEDRVCYGPPLPEGQTYKTLMTKKIRLDPHRVHFVDPLPYRHYLEILQASSVHVYLTVPFVLSWSMLEAMSCGCLVVASDTPPVREVIHDGVNGILTDLFSPEQIARKVVACLDYPSFMKTIKKNARKTILEKYNLNNMLPRQLHLINQLTAASDQHNLFG
ncbi:MAG: glycosyltransferase [Desulfotignum sp.]|nr:glycosyltransferase [Desulfotignum sp.]MCF8125871.1 glycosyltransferase [Desulfotignum sp.]